MEIETMHLLSRSAAGLCAVGALLCLSATVAQAHGGWSLNVDIGLPAIPLYVDTGYGLPAGAASVYVGGTRYWRHGGLWYRPWGPRWVVVPAPVELVAVQPASLPEPALAPSRPDPVIYPRNGQSEAQTESDRRECNRWATGQPAAQADAAVFQRAVEACMDGRGYTMK
jgi:hypothetical protein